MRKKRLLKDETSSGDRLRRIGEQQEPFEKRGGLSVGNLIVIGASAGGYHALKEVVRVLSWDIPAALIILLHRSRVSQQEHGLENILRGSTVVPIVAVQAGDRLQRGRIYIPPAGYSVFLKERTLHLEPQTEDIPITTINRLFQSAAMYYRERVIGVILSGLLSDGTAGLQSVHDAGGLTIVQDPSEAEYPDMPANAMQHLPVTFCLKLPEIGLALDILARRQTELESGLAVSVRMLKERVVVLGRLLSQSKGNPGTYRFLSTEISLLHRDLRSLETLVNEQSMIEKPN